jgi:hypothetical protein
VRTVKLDDRNAEYSNSDSDLEYCYGVQLTGDVNSVRGPYVTVQLNEIPTKLLADSGSSVNIIDEDDYTRIGKPKLHKRKLKGELSMFLEHVT